MSTQVLSKWFSTPFFHFTLASSTFGWLLTTQKTLGEFQLFLLLYATPKTRTWTYEVKLKNLNDKGALLRGTPHGSCEPQVKHEKKGTKVRHNFQLSSFCRINKTMTDAKPLGHKTWYLKNKVDQNAWGEFVAWVLVNPIPLLRRRREKNTPRAELVVGFNQVPWHCICSTVQVRTCCTRETGKKGNHLCHESEFRFQIIFVGRRAGRTWPWPWRPDVSVSLLPLGCPLRRWQVPSGNGSV